MSSVQCAASAAPAALLADSRVYLVAQPTRTGCVELIDWGHQRASVRWDSGLLCGVALADLAPVA